MDKSIQERLAQLRSRMAERGIAVYVIPTADFHESEYVGEHFKTRAYMTGFTGSAGTAVISMEEAGLWTDARYFLQAGEQLKGSEITLFRMGEEGVPTASAYVEEILSRYDGKYGRRLAFDGRVINAALGQKFEEIADRHQMEVYAGEDLVDLIWEDRPALPCEKAWILAEKYTGESTSSKLAQVRDRMREAGAEAHVMTALYDICWLLNIRGSDISYVPVVLSYLMIWKEQCIWFVQEQALDGKVKTYLEENQITCRPYEEFYSYLEQLTTGCTVLLDRNVVNYRAVSCIPQDVTIIDEVNPAVYLKAVKNEVQMENIRQAHIKDAVAMCKFMCYLKSNIGRVPMTELSTACKLEELRRQQEGFLELSFETISAYAEHGAIVHYAVTEASDRPLEPEGFLLVDSGGHYLEGTTDITRTFALGPITDEMRENFTRVCRANLNLASARFLKGCTGVNLDILAREPLWEAGLDYKHGTGHGVGYLLNVHEGPNAFRWRCLPGRAEDSVLEEGMVTTDEPGLYIAGEYGIRIENELLCRKGEKNDFGQFMYFENLTYVPIDLDAIEPSLMTETERARLNAYHALVFEKISPYLEGEELDFLRRYTRAI